MGWCSTATPALTQRILHRDSPLALTSHGGSWQGCCSPHILKLLCGASSRRPACSAAVLVRPTPANDFLLQVREEKARVGQEVAESKRVAEESTKKVREGGWVDGRALDTQEVA